jgi:rfaE bifunctional protein kinase chain/domain
MFGSLAALVDQLKAGVKVGVIGDVMLDRYISGRAERISPEAPIPVVDVQEETARAGAAANVAIKALQLGAQARLVGMYGADRHGEQLLDCCRELNLEPGDLVQTAERPTTVKTRVTSRHQQMVRVDREVRTPAKGDLEQQLCKRAREVAAWADALVLEDYDKGVLTRAVLRAAIDEARTRGIPIVVDPKVRPC